MNRLDLLHLPLDGVRLIEASAGTGKTHAIATLYLRLVLGVNAATPRRVQDILVVTFTRAATEELRGRARARLYEALDVLERVQAGARDLLADGGPLDTPLRELLAAVDAAGRSAESIVRLRLELATLDDAAIFTIHGFCQRALQEQAFDSGENFELDLVQDDSQRELQAVQDHWRTRYYGSDLLAGVARARWGDPAGLHRALRPLLAPGLGLQYARVTPEQLQAQRAQLVAAWRAGGAELVQAINEFKPLSRGDYKTEFVAAAAAAVDSWCGEDALELPPEAKLFLRAMLDNKITDANKRNGVRLPAHPLQDALEAYAAAVSGLLHTLLADAADDVRARLDAARRQSGAAAFDDLVQRLHAALHGPGGARLAGALARRYPVALIDEFQDTDPLQYGIFSRIYSAADTLAAGTTALLLIGDPKQAIYSFRGADIFAYLRARRDAGAERRYSLDTNWRSVTPLVAGVNALFTRQAAPFLYADAIEFEPARAAGRADRRRLTERGHAPVPLEFWALPAPDRGKTVSKEIAAADVLPQLARRVAALLANGRRRDGNGQDVALAPRDIAVLVRTNAQGAEVQAALRALGIGSAMTGTASVFAGDEAIALRDVLQSIADPASDRALRRALVSPLWPHDADFLATLDDDSPRYEALLRQLHDWHALWQGRGFMPMFRAFLHHVPHGHEHAVPHGGADDAPGVAGQLLARPGGERMMTNIVQLAELLQQASRAHPAPDSLLRWLDDAIAEPDGNADEQQLRLESDEDLVQILTLHRSKGLEYPVVFLPFMHDARPVDPKKGFPRFHDDDGRLQVDLAAGADSVARADYERLAEDLRLLYVALTRAKDYCIVPWGRINTAETAALASLLHGPEALADVAALAAAVAPLDAAAVRAGLDALAAAHPHSLRVVDLADAVPAGTATPPALPATPVLSARTVARRVQRTRVTTSYSGLLQDAHEDARDVGERREAIPPADAVPALSAFTLRGGTATGHLFHDLLETLDYRQRDDAALHARVAAELGSRAMPAEWCELVSTMIRTTLDTPLDDTGFCLNSLTARQRRNEMEFWVPLKNVRADALEALLPGLGAGISGPRLSFAPMQGYLQGFIDLVFEHGGRWYVADWKTNKLGPDATHYTREHLARAIAQHRYDLQYTLYTLALHRHLQRRLGAAYAPEKHLGGVYYLFLRGMDAARPGRPGVWHVPADPAQIARLDALFRGERP